MSTAKMSDDAKKELERGTQLRGFRYGLHDFYAYLGGAKRVKKSNDFVEAGFLKDRLLDRKTKELAIIAVCVALNGSVPHLQLHMHAAHKAGATPEEILELVELVRPWVGALSRIVGLEAWRATFRPDIPPIDRVIELR